MNIKENYICVCDFPWTAGVWVWFSITTSGHMCLSGHVGMISKHKWRSLECLINILTYLLRRTWPEVVTGNHTHMSAVHGKSFHIGLTKRSITFNYHQFEEFLTTVQWFVQFQRLIDHCADHHYNGKVFIMSSFDKFFN